MESIVGSTALTGGAGLKRTFVFNARKAADGTVMGQFSGINRNVGSEFSGTLTCMTIVNGNEAWFAGLIEDSNIPGLINTEWGWRAVDGPDQVTFGARISLPADDWANAAEFCAETRTDKPNLHPNESGAIRIQG